MLSIAQLHAINNQNRKHNQKHDQEQALEELQAKEWHQRSSSFLNHEYSSKGQRKQGRRYKSESKE